MKNFILAIFMLLSICTYLDAQKKIEGEVIKIEKGKDGYTATVLAKNKKTYEVTISVANLKNHEEYRRVAVGETIKLSGEHWMMGREHYITIRKLYPSQTEEIEDITTDKLIEIEGEVTKIENGEDGYTATVVTKDKKSYEVTISLPNLDNHEEYRRVAVGETIKLSGEHWMMGTQNRITIRKLYPSQTEEIEDPSTDKIIEIEGKVTKIENGRDGYTATVITKDKKNYEVTISIPNLDNHEEYRRVKVGEKIKLNGEHWMMGTQHRITIRKLYPME